MSGWGDIMSLGATVRPLSDPKPPQAGRWSSFSATLGSTVEILATELRALKASNVVLELDLRERDIRVDGWPRADARPVHDGVALSFDSKFGPQRYATAEYTNTWNRPGWQSNLRAIALSLRALRSVDRYGVSKRGEQYRGWQAIPQTAGGDIQTREQAEAFIAEYGGSYREAAKRLHPDHDGGDAEMFKRLTQAKTLLA